MLIQRIPHFSLQFLSKLGTQHEEANSAEKRGLCAILVFQIFRGCSCLWGSSSQEPARLSQPIMSFDEAKVEKK